MEMLQSPEALGAAQQDARLHPVLVIEAHQLVREQAVRGPVALPEVGRELQTVVVHGCGPAQGASARAPPAASASAAAASAASASASSRRSGGRRSTTCSTYASR